MIRLENYAKAKYEIVGVYVCLNRVLYDSSKAKTTITHNILIMVVVLSVCYRASCYIP